MSTCFFETWAPTGANLDSRPVLGSTLSPGAKLALFALRRFARQKTTCWPGQQRLAADIGCSSRSVRSYLAELRASGAVTVRRRGLGRTNVYSLLPIWTGKERRSEAADSAEKTLRETSRKEKQPKRAAPATVQPTAQGSGADVVAKMLTAEGVSATVAATIATEANEADVREQVAALPHRKPRDRAAVLVASVRERWELPATYRAEQRKREIEAARARERDRDDVLAIALEKTRSQALKRLDSMPRNERVELEARARADVTVRTNRLLLTGSPAIVERMVAARLTVLAGECSA